MQCSFSGFYINFTMNKKQLTFKQLAVIGLITAMLNACDSKDRSVLVNGNSPSEFPLPQVLRTVRAIDPEAVTLAVEVNSKAVEVLKTGSDPDLWSTVVNVPAGRTSIVNVNWSHTYQTRDNTYDLMLAQQQKVVLVGSQPEEVYFRIGGYNIDNFDQDEDGYSNLAEIEEGRSPVDRVDGYINDSGIYPTGASYLPSTECGTQMPIATQVQFSTTEPGDVSASDLKAWWCSSYKAAQRDEFGALVSPEGLEIIVNVIDDVSPLVDSGLSRRYDDDSVEIFIDGNNSKGNNYDGWDDYQFIFLADGDNDSPLEKGRATPDGLTSTVVVTANGYKLIVFLPRQAVGIQHGQPFGINIEVNDDDDGGFRDSKLTWIGLEGVDRSWILPRAFGTSQIP